MADIAEVKVDPAPTIHGEFLELNGVNTVNGITKPIGRRLVNRRHILQVSRIQEYEATAVTCIGIHSFEVSDSVETIRALLASAPPA